jgi:AcrR family transcriptional regulator
MTGARVPLTPDLIFERALAIVDAEGLEALSMRRLASDLGVEAASLYHHITDKQALLDGVIARARAEMRVTVDPSVGWAPFLEEVFIEYRRLLVAHPNLMGLAGWRLENGMEDGLAYLVAVGFSLDDAVELMQSLVAIAVGFAMFSAPRAQLWNRGLPPEAVVRMADWREETCRAAARVILESFAPRLGSARSLI